MRFKDVYRGARWTGEYLVVRLLVSGINGNDRTVESSNDK